MEERIDGMNFGVEIYGDPDGYVVSDPIIFSTGKDGVTDPFNSVKYGPIRDESYHVDELKEQVMQYEDVLYMTSEDYEFSYTAEENLVRFIVQIDGTLMFDSHLSLCAPSYGDIFEKSNE